METAQEKEKSLTVRTPDEKALDDSVKRNAGAEATSSSATPAASHPPAADLQKIFTIRCCLPVYNDVHISPNPMEFKDAYEGKEYSKLLKLTNIGKKIVYIRIGHPTSCRFLIETLLRPTPLSPGMSITKKVNYTYRILYPTSEAGIPLYINDDCVYCILRVYTAEAKILVEPKILDFGVIDALNTGSWKTVSIKNTGSKRLNFAIDIANRELELLVEPLKGFVEPKSSVNLKVEVVGLKEGIFEKQFWIKITPPVQVKVIGEFIAPKLLPMSPSTQIDFVFMQFDRLFIGQSESRVLVIKNLSSSDAMFCVLAQNNHGEFVTFDMLVNDDKILNTFKVRPIEGRMEAQQAVTIRITYRPIEMNTDNVICFIMIKKIICKCVSTDAILSEDFDDDDDVCRLTQSGSLLAIPLAEEFYEEERIKEERIDNSIQEYSHIKVCLYGDMEQAKIKLTPESIELGDVSSNELYEREVFVENLSRNKGLNFRFEKTPCVFVETPFNYLKPRESVPIAVRIKPQSLGLHKNKIPITLYHKNFTSLDHTKIVIGTETFIVSFNVVSHPAKAKPKFNYGITPMMTNEVGYLVNDVRFNSQIKKPRAAMVLETKSFIQRENNALIAFPNDRPTALRPWRLKTPCLTIFAKLPRTIVSRDNYNMTLSEEEFKLQQDKYYQDYIRRNQGKQSAVELYTRNHERNLRLLFQKYTCPTENVEKEIKEIKFDEFIPLTPLQLNNIDIQPRYIRLKKIAPNSRIMENISLHNANKFPIYVYLMTDKYGVAFPQGHRKIVKPNETKSFLLTCCAGTVGRYINKVEILINFSHIFNLSVVVEVVPKSIKIADNKLVFEPQNFLEMFFPLENNLNSPISFSWDIHENSAYKVYPMRGVIPQKKWMTCMLEYVPQPNVADSTEVTFICEGGANQIIQVSRAKAFPSVAFSNLELDLGLIPLNVQKTRLILLRNLSTYDICFLLTKTEEPGVKISPKNGVIHAKGDQAFHVEVLVSDEVGHIRYTFHFLLDEHYPVDFVVFGEVIYPNVTVSPNALVHRGLFRYSYKKSHFILKNISSCECYVRFALDEYKEFSITEYEKTDWPSTHNKNVKLLPGQSKIMFLHVLARDVNAVNIHLPIVINDIIGPPIINAPNTCLSRHFLHNDETNVPMPKILPLLKITNITSNNPVEFNTLFITFEDFNDQDKGEQIKTFTIINKGQNKIELCIRTETINKPFTMEAKSANIEAYQISFVCRLNPGESAHYIIKFMPTTFGKHFRRIPIFLRGYHEGAVFTYLKITGIYHAPTITTDRDIYCLEPIPVMISSQLIIKLFLECHKNNCHLTFTSPNELSVMFTETREKKKLLNVEVTFGSLKSQSVKGRIRFSCSCGASCSPMVTINSDNSLFTHYVFFHIEHQYFYEILPTSGSMLGHSKKEDSYPGSVESLVFSPSEFENRSTISICSMFSSVPVNKNDHCFPFFPDDQEKDKEYLCYMRKVATAVENWVYSQCFNKKKYLKIPDTISMPPMDVAVISKKKKPASTIGQTKRIIEPFLAEIIIVICGPQIRRIIMTCMPESKNEEDIALHFLITYTNILKFLKSHGASVSHVFPELLLSHRQFVLLFTLTPEKLTIKKLYNNEKFYALSKQCYVDVILQIIKLFILGRVTMFPKSLSPSRQSSRISRISVQRMNILTETQLAFSHKWSDHNYSKHEVVLLYWLQYHFDNQRLTIWEPETYGEETIYVANKNIRFFDVDLKDSLALAAVTAAYCPYIADGFKTMYLRPAGYEELFHNACCIVKVWRMLKLSYDIRPQDIINPNLVNMLLLVLYLYDVLPHFYPYQKVTMKAKLTQETETTLTISNNADHNVSFSILFFNDEHKVFRSESNQFSVQYSRNGNLKIIYTAKKIFPVKSILVLSGETAGFKYAKSLAVTLIGEPDLNNPVNELELTANFYQLYNMKYQLFPPYDVPDTYTMYYNVTDKDQFDSSMYSWKKYLSYDVPRRLFTKDSILHVADVTQGCYFEPIVCCALPQTKIFNMFLIGAHGDWSFRFTITPKINKRNHEVIQVNLPKGFMLQECICRSNDEFYMLCPRTIWINIPSKNNLLWNSMKQMLLACSNDTKWDFWNKYLGSHVGINILKKLLELEATPGKLSDFCKRKLEFQITIDHESREFIQTNKVVVIEDAFSDTTVDLPVHLNMAFDPKHDCLLKLETTENIEIRFYSLTFLEHQ